jgi:hypothetical protein
LFVPISISQNLVVFETILTILYNCFCLFCHKYITKRGLCQEVARKIRNKGQKKLKQAGFLRSFEEVWNNAKKA